MKSPPKWVEVVADSVTVHWTSLFSESCNWMIPSNNTITVSVNQRILFWRPRTRGQEGPIPHSLQSQWCPQNLSALKEVHMTNKVISGTLADHAFLCSLTPSFISHLQYSEIEKKNQTNIKLINDIQIKWTDINNLVFFFPNSAFQR